MFHDPTVERTEGGKALDDNQARSMAKLVDFVSQEYLRNPSRAVARLRAVGPIVEVNFPIIGKV